MAKRSTSCTTITPTGFADATNMTDNTYPFLLQGGSTTQISNIIEIMETGQAAASAINIMVLSADSTIAVTNSLGATQNDAPLNGASAALAAPAKVGNTNTTKPQRSATLHLLNLAFNSFGGIIRWVAAPGEEITVTGNAVNVGEVSLSAFTGSPGAMGCHVIYETF